MAFCSQWKEWDAYKGQLILYTLDSYYRIRWIAASSLTSPDRSEVTSLDKTILLKMAKIRRGILPHQNHGLEQPYIFLKNVSSVFCDIICFCSWYKSNNVRITGILTVSYFSNVGWKYSEVSWSAKHILHINIFLVWLFCSLLFN